MSNVKHVRARNACAWVLCLRWAGWEPYSHMTSRCRSMATRCNGFTCLWMVPKPVLYNPGPLIDRLTTYYDDVTNVWSKCRFIISIFRNYWHFSVLIRLAPGGLIMYGALPNLVHLYSLSLRSLFNFRHFILLIFFIWDLTLLLTYQRSFFDLSPWSINLLKGLQWMSTLSLIHFGHFREICPTGIILLGWVQNFTDYHGSSSTVANELVAQHFLVCLEISLQSPREGARRKFYPPSPRSIPFPLEKSSQWRRSQSHAIFSRWKRQNRKDAFFKWKSVERVQGFQVKR